MKRLFFLLCAAGMLYAVLTGCTTTGKTAAGGSQTTQAAEETDPTTAYKNIALGKTAVSNNHIYEFTASKAFDGDVNTYYEGAAKNYPNELTVDLGSPKDLYAVSLKLNPKRIWQSRTQTFEIQTSQDGESFTPAVASADYEFDPVANKNTVTVKFNANGQFVRLVFTANTEATGGQVAEVEVYGE